ncbi:hypothetical protein Tco_1243561 [Tanacetum coccineum]
MQDQVQRFRNRSNELLSLEGGTNSVEEGEDIGTSPELIDTGVHFMKSGPELLVPEPIAHPHQNQREVIIYSSLRALLQLAYDFDFHQTPVFAVETSATDVSEDSEPSQNIQARFDYNSVSLLF